MKDRTAPCTLSPACPGHDLEEPVDSPPAEIEVKGPVASGRLVRDDAPWFHNWR